MIGEFLSLMVNKEKANTKCPSLEDIAVFLSANLMIWTEMQLWGT